MSRRATVKRPGDPWDRGHLGGETRGKTAPGRLRPLDIYLRERERGLLRRRQGRWSEAVVVDLGFGWLPQTTLDIARSLREVAPELGFVGLEIVPERVQAAAPFAGPGLRFAEGGFEIPVEEPVRLIRALNVLRQYEEEAVGPAWERMGRALLPGGLLVEGTCDPFGRRTAVALLRRAETGLVLEGLLFHLRMSSGSAGRRESVDELLAQGPAVLQAVLPKYWIHRCVPGEPVHGMFSDWDAAWRQARFLRPFGPRQVFRHAARTLAEKRGDIRSDRWMRDRGYLLWRP